MDGYGEATYGDRFADVYDEWYGEVSDAEATVARIAELATTCGAGAAVLELGVGTGRLAIPLAGLGLDVHGVDSSPRMLERLAAKPGGSAVTAVLGPMEGDVPAGPFAVVFAAFNTFFNLDSPAAQRTCFRSVARRLVPGGAFVIETVVPAGGPEEDTTDLTVRTVETDRVVVVATRTGRGGAVSGQHVELSERGIRLRPWRLRLTPPAELDEMAAAAGLRLDAATADWRGSPYGDASPTRVALYRHMHP